MIAKFGNTGYFYAKFDNLMNKSLIKLAYEYSYQKVNIIVYISLLNLAMQTPRKTFGLLPDRG